MQAIIWQMHATYSAHMAWKEGPHNKHLIQTPPKSALLSFLEGASVTQCNVPSTIMVVMMQVSHPVVWMSSSSWIMYRVAATDMAMQQVT